MLKRGHLVIFISYKRISLALRVSIHETKSKNRKKCVRPWYAQLQVFEEKNYKCWKFCVGPKKNSSWNALKKILCNFFGPYKKFPSLKLSRAYQGSNTFFPFFCCRILDRYPKNFHHKNLVARIRAQTHFFRFFVVVSWIDTQKISITKT